MTYAVSGIKTSNGGSRTNITLYDTEEAARSVAENLLHNSEWSEVAVWKQIGVPKLETKVSWEGSEA